MLRPRNLSSLLFAAASLIVGPAQAQQATELRTLLPTVAGRDAPSPNNADNEPPPLTTTDRSSLEGAQSADVIGSAIRIGSVLVETAESIDHTVFERAIEPYLGKEASNQDISKLAQEIAEIARSQGLVLANAHVPAQQIEMGILRVVLTAGGIDEVRITGSSNRALKELLAPLVSKTLMQKELERRLTLANNIPEIIVRRSELVQEGDRRVLLVKVEPRKKASGQVSVDNYGSDGVGPLRARLSLDTVALLDDSDSLNVTFRTNPADPGELVSASSVYRIGLNNNGTRAEIATSWSESNIEPQFGNAKRDASSRYASISLTHPIQRSRAANLWAEGQLEYLKIEQESLGQLLQSDTVVTLSIGLSSSFKAGSGVLRAGTQIRQGLGILGANQRGDLLSSRDDADGRFTAARAWANWSGKPVGDLTLRVAISGQLANEALLSTEELGLGGSGFGRAFNFYEYSGDQGLMGSVELGYEFLNPATWLKKLQPYAFVDGGYVDNLRGGFGGGSLMSVGAGLRAEIGPVGLQLETAVPVLQSGQGTNDASPKVNFQVGLGF